MIGPPNAGLLDSLLHLSEGIKPVTRIPTYPAAIVGTMPSAYQLLPPTRHQPVLDSSGNPVKDLYAPELWRRNHWGLADPRQEKVLKELLPEIQDAWKRREIALDHQAKSLHRAKQFAAAMDLPARSPAGIQLFLVAGIRTPRTGPLNSTPMGNCGSLRKVLVTARYYVAVPCLMNVYHRNRISG
ncbi:hypothetical protein [Desulfosarcina alkanivorans]|jgi:hypothetical protein|uniref:hypothetical protein n=1 Tax=Desulfosarcina alkanivorans TaxID=571177 RepID=UPI0012D35D70|nr:hypothetical protein [Desulfosarcina alkanivorans]